MVHGVTLPNVHQVMPDDEANPSFHTECQPLLNPATTSEVTLNDCSAEDDSYSAHITNSVADSVDDYGSVSQSTTT